LLEAADGGGELHVYPLESGEHLSHVERLREEPLYLARARYGELVFVRQLVDAEDGDDVLQILVALQDALDLLRHGVMFVADDARIENAGRRRQRIDRRIDAQFGDGARGV